MSERREINGAPFILRMLADEIDANESLNLEARWAARTIAGLVSEIDHLQEQWMDEYIAWGARLSEGAGHALSALDRIKSLETERDSALEHCAHWTKRYEDEKAHKRAIAAEAQAEVAALNAHIADLTHRLEGAKDATARNLDLTAKIAEAVAELTRLGNEQGGATTAECHRIANRLRGGAKRPEPGMEVEA